jgi:malonate transporter
MNAVLTVLGTLSAIVVAGFLIARLRILGASAAPVLARVVFTVATPCLLVSTVAHADLSTLVSRVTGVTWLSSALVALAAIFVLRRVWHRSAPDTALGVLASVYVNAGNLGLPVAVYLLGDALAVVPTLLFQLLLLGPAAFAVLDSANGLRGAVRSTVRNPIVVSAVAGGILAALPWKLPDVAFEPFRMIGAAAAPLALIVFGM